MRTLRMGDHLRQESAPRGEVWAVSDIESNAVSHEKAQSDEEDSRGKFT